jgi:mRNA interferase MazF
VAKKYVPKRGHIVFTDFDPAAGHEQAMPRPSLVLSPEAFNHKIKLALVAPITGRIRGHGFEVVLEGTTTHGVVLCHQVKIIDYNARGVRFIERAPQLIVQEALAKVQTLVT